MKARPVAATVLAVALLWLAAALLPAAAPDARAPSAHAAPAVSLTPVAAGFTGSPVFVTQAPDGSNRLFVVERSGTIKIVVDGAVRPTPCLDIGDRVKSGGEQGLLGLAFDPNYAANGRFFVFYTAAGSPTGVGDNTLARYQVLGDRDVADRSSGTVLLSLPDDYTNHNGGMLAFGRDGYLYVGTGDEGSTGDPKNNAQNLGSLYGKLLRLDVSGTGYTPATGNPFLGQAGARPEIWAYGLRNPWRFSFDRATADLYIGDVGQGLYEEIDFQPAGSRGGENYGWKIMEGAHCYGSDSCDRAGLMPPVSEYGRDLGCSVSGGYVYRGAAIPSLVGAYLFGDFCSGRIWSLRRGGDGAWSRTDLLDTDLRISSFGEDRHGEVYVVDLAGNGIHRLIGAPPPAATLVSPSGTITDTTPTYTWNKLDGSTWYYLYVRGPNGYVADWWEDRDGLCAGTTCSVDPTTRPGLRNLGAARWTLPSGDHEWWVQTWNPSGFGPWSAAMAFRVNVPPAAATLVSPSGTITDTTPTYTWDAVSGATWYYLLVNGPSGNVIGQWYAAEQTGCASGTERCSVTPATALAAATYTWWIMAWNEGGYGPWSVGMSFTVGAGSPSVEQRSASPSPSPVPSPGPR